MDSSRYPKFACPKCGALLPASGEVVVAGEMLAVYQCDDCIVKVPFGCEMMEVCYTFCVDKSGDYFDPAAPDELLN